MVTANVSRRGLLAAGLSTGAFTLIGCSSSSSKSSGQAPKTLSMWHNNGNRKKLYAGLADKFAAKPGGEPVKITYEPLSSIGKSLQLAHQSHQMPDIQPLAGLNIPPAQLQSDGWFHPLDISSAVKSRLPAGSLVDGLTVFNGKPYSFPLTSFRQYWAPVWYLADFVAKYGLDPDDRPATYDEFRRACQTVKKKSDGKVFGWVSKFGVSNHMGPETQDLAQAAGFAGANGMDFRTGQYAYHDDHYVQAVEFVMSLVKDGLVFPGSISITGTQGQQRWAAGTSAFWIDGPWLPHFVATQVPQFMSQLRVSPILVPESGHTVQTYRPSPGGAFWISSQSRQPDEANKFLTEMFTTKSFYKALAEGSDVPADLSVIPDADVPKATKQLFAWFKESVFLAPEPIVKNPDVAKVASALKPVSPSYFDTLDGLWSGQLKNPRQALKKLSDASERALDAAIKAANSRGAHVSRDDYAFPDWEPGKDYAPHAK